MSPEPMPCKGERYVMSGPVGAMVLQILGYEGPECCWCDEAPGNGGTCTRVFTNPASDELVAEALKTSEDQA